MKNITNSVEHLLLFAELDANDAGQLIIAVALYLRDGTLPTFKNAALKALFSLFRSSIDAQNESSITRSITNRENALCKKSAAKKKGSKKTSEADSYVVPNNDSKQIANDSNESLAPIALEQIEAVYPRLGTYRDESLSIWSKMDETDKLKAIAYVKNYSEQHPATEDLLYLNQYLKAGLWNK